MRELYREGTSKAEIARRLNIGGTSVRFEKKTGTSSECFSRNSRNP